MRRPVLGPALTALSPDQLGNLQLHHLRRDRLDRLADHVSVLIEQHALDDLLDRHPVGAGHEAQLLDWSKGRAVIVTGTPGAGKTTTAMKAALALRAEGFVVRFVDVEDVDSYRSVLHEVIDTADPYCLVIDNAELLGSWAPSIANEFLQKQENGRIVMAVARTRLAALRLDDFESSRA